MSTLLTVLQKSIPYKLGKRDPSLCEWLYTGGKNFNEPFFDDSVSACKQLKENNGRYKSLSQLNMLEKWAEELQHIPDPSAIIFHVSRCGSTLLSQLLGLNDRHMVLSEVPFFDELLRLPVKQEKIKGEEVASLLKASVKIYGNSRAEIPAHVFIKTDSWHLLFYEQFRNMFPGTLVILLFRDPWEVIQSQQRRRGMQSVPGVLESSLFGFTAEEANETNLDKYMAMVLQRYFAKMIHIADNDPLTQLVNYSEGVENSMKKIYLHLKIPMETATEVGSHQRVKYHGKYPGQLFTEENEDTLPPGFLDPVMELYQELDRLRLLRNG
jgi:hypothetical protein